MSRSMFGSWGAALPHEAFVKAVAAVAALGVSKDALEKQAIIDAGRAMRSAGIDIAVLRLEHLAELVDGIANNIDDLRPAQEYLAAWERFEDLWYYELPPNAPFLRLEIDSAVATDLRLRAPDLHWLIKILIGRSGSLVSSAYVRLDEPDRPIAGEWPLRVGVLGDARSLELAEHVMAVPWPRLVRLTRLDIADEDCDLPSLPDDLRASLARVLQQPRRLRADCVLLVGGAGVAADRITHLAGAMRAESDRVASVFAASILISNESGSSY